jgi:hypothetical protein
MAPASSAIGRFGQMIDHCIANELREIEPDISREEVSRDA